MHPCHDTLLEVCKEPLGVGSVSSLFQGSNSGLQPCTPNTLSPEPPHQPRSHFNRLLTVTLFFSLLNFHLFSHLSTRLPTCLLLYQPFIHLYIRLPVCLSLIGPCIHPLSQSCSQPSTLPSIHSPTYPVCLPMYQLVKPPAHLSSHPLAHPPITGVKHLCCAGHCVSAEDVVMCAESPCPPGFPSSSQLCHLPCCATAPSSFSLIASADHSSTQWRCVKCRSSDTNYPLSISP